MYLYNNTFMIDRSLESDFLIWIKRFFPNFLPYDPLLTQVVEVPGDPEFAQQALSFALQLHFPTIEAAHEWGENSLPSILQNYSSTFTPDRALHFATILKVVSSE